MERKRKIEFIIASLFILSILILVLIFGYLNSEEKKINVFYEKESIFILNKNYFFESEKIKYESFEEKFYLKKEVEKEFFMDKNQLILKKRYLYEKNYFSSLQVKVR